jgi:hypothetical protein
VLVQTGSFWEVRGEAHANTLKNCRQFVVKNTNTNKEEVRAGVGKYSSIMANPDSDGRWDSELTAGSYIVLNHLPKENGKIRRVVFKIETGEPVIDKPHEEVKKEEKELSGREIAERLMDSFED